MPHSQSWKELNFWGDEQQADVKPYDFCDHGIMDGIAELAKKQHRGLTEIPICTKTTCSLPSV